MQIGRRLRQLREERGLTLAEVADAAGISISHLSAIENGTRPNPSFLVVAKLARTYGVPIDSFLDPDLFPSHHDVEDADASLDVSYAEMAKRLAEADALANPAALLEVLAAYLREREQQYHSHASEDGGKSASEEDGQRPDR
ncbi:hypothetical protein Alches_04400 [Alicyclobacillus hesperidum subsp. aegles]|uniref:helix-turn-helix domain-containing protein n=1 Tax=Alicyclobacillus hesperidum TaxID=89784 RepID=UPI0007192D95|nr:helix-turn-helix transcriptional regulator [Alicyclobacillus hesperidum]KRW92994.1 XRE family transcriptional regulator [Alicyclobacillus tengchongensis]GLG00401.1 hypothetical protein Alches_04400 [Alicyclobacillus hesperidum subsp. aegles]